jgi:3-hydroxyisobutyrate dehydrogenase-like beta-hydroxyacid dehydrogenase
MDQRSFGFVGLGQMGGPMASNIAEAGYELEVFDQAGTQARAPQKAKAAGSTANLARDCDTIFLSVPDGKASIAIAREIAAVDRRRVRTVIDLSTIGIPAAVEAADILAAAGIEYVDAPVSGGRKGAIAASISVMWGGSKEAFDAHAGVLAAFARNPFHVGLRPGQGQALKMLNNFLSATAMAATAEAVLFGLSQGLEMKTILDTVNVSTGQNTATRDKFPDQILTGNFEAGFATSLITKDVRLYMESVDAAGTPGYLGGRVSRILAACNDQMPESDFTRIYEFIRDGGETGLEDS